MNVFVTGVTGFIGLYVLDALKAAGHAARCLVRETRPRNVATVRGDVTRTSTLRGAMDGCDAVIHLVGIIEERPQDNITFAALHVEATQNVVAEAQRAGITRFVHMSANGAAKDGVSRYQTTKWQAEEVVSDAGFGHWTILRPGLVFGEPKPGTTEFCTQMARELILPLPIVPLFGRGEFVLRPVSVDEVATALTQALVRPAVCGRTIVAVGEESLSYSDVIDRIAQGLGQQPPRKLHIPVGLMRQVIRHLGPLGILPISTDQFEMLVGGNDGDPTSFYALYDLEPKPFTVDNLSYLRRRAQGL